MDIDAIPDLLLFIQQKLRIVSHRYGRLSFDSSYCLARKCVQLLPFQLSLEPSVPPELMQISEGKVGHNYLGKTYISVLHDAQLLLNKQQQIWDGVYIHLTFFEQYRARYGNLAPTYVNVKNLTVLNSV